MKATVSMELLWQTIQSQEEKNVEYITKAELLEGIRQGLKDVQESRKSGERLKTLQEVIDEL